MKRLTENKIGNFYPLKIKTTPETDTNKNYDGFYACLEAVNRLGEIVDILGVEYNLDRLKELVQADKEKRIKIINFFDDKSCANCKHFNRIVGTARGECAVKPYYEIRGKNDLKRKFIPPQSHKACSKFEEKQENKINYKYVIVSEDCSIQGCPVK